MRKSIQGKNIDRPIFIIGVGRSGSSIFHRLLSEHPEVAWISERLSNKYPGKPELNAYLMNGINCPLLKRFLKNNFQPGEGYGFWEYYCPGFRRPCRDLVAQDVTIRKRKAIHAAMSKILTRRRNRLLIKITGWPRIGFLQEIFQDASFIHIRRDPRGVINSMVNIDWWWGWRGPQNWRWGELTPELREEWKKFDYSFLALAGIELQILAQAMAKAREFVDENRFMEITYRDLCADYIGSLHQVTEFCQLEWSANFERALAGHVIKDQSERWRQELTAEQQTIVEYFAKTLENI